MAKYEHRVTDEELGLTINQILRRNYDFSARFRTKIKYQSLVDLNGTPVPGYIKPDVGDVVSVRLPAEFSDFTPEDIPLDIIYEDSDLIIINKQAGITVHPTKGHPDHTVANGLMKYMADSGQSFKIRFANRIDMDTSGIIVVAKNANTQNGISEQMRSGTVIKRYIALSEGDISEKHFEIDLPVGRPSQESIRRAVMPEGGKEAKSEFRVLRRFGSHTLLEVTLHTGRTHQIRVHLSHAGHPIAGDSLYGGSTGLISRQALHACHMEFVHPMSGEHMSFDAGLPQDIKSVLETLGASPKILLP